MIRYSMADVISLNEKIECAKAQEAATWKRQKLQAIQRMLQCTHCSAKCTKCGAHLTVGAVRSTQNCSVRVPYRFCETCREEYTQYIELLAGGKNPDCYWHNHEWMDMWGRWIEYQGAVDQFLRSKEFIRLVKELEEIGPDP